MKLRIDFDDLEKNNLTPFELIYLYYFFDKKDSNTLTLDIPKLVKNKYIVKNKDSYILSNKGRKLFNNLTNNNIESLSIKYRELFPVGVKSGGHPIRSNLKDIEKKFSKFFEEYNYPHEVILEATKIYLEERAKTNYSYCMLANYFIIKQDSKGEKSVLASYCESYLEKGEDINEEIIESV